MANSWFCLLNHICGKGMSLGEDIQAPVSVFFDVTWNWDTMRNSIKETMEKTNSTPSDLLSFLPDHAGWLRKTLMAQWIGPLQVFQSVINHHQTIIFEAHWPHCLWGRATSKIRAYCTTKSTYWILLGHAACVASGSHSDAETWQSQIWPWVKTYDAIFGWMNIHECHLFWCSLGARVLTHCQLAAGFFKEWFVAIHNPW